MVCLTMHIAYITIYICIHISICSISKTVTYCDVVSDYVSLCAIMLDDCQLKLFCFCMITVAV